jgi:hypothetical protein
MAHDFIMRMLTNKADPLRNTLEEIIDWMENPVNIDRVDMVPLIEANRDIVPKEHLIGKASLPLCCETACTSIMSRPSAGVDRSLFTDGSKSTEVSFGGYSVFDCNEDKGWGFIFGKMFSRKMMFKRAEEMEVAWSKVGAIRRML